MRYLWILTAVLIALGFFRLAFCRPALPSPGGVDAVLQGTSALYAALLMLNRSRRDESGGKWLLLGLGCLANFVVPYVPLAAPVVTNDFLADSGITGTLVALEQIFFLLAVHMMLRRAGLDGVRDYLDIMIYTVVIVSLCGFARMGSSTADLSIPRAMIELMGVAVSTAMMVGLVMLLSHEEGCGGRSTLLILAGFAALTAASPLSLEWQLIGNGSRVSDRWTEFLQFAGMMLLGMAALFDGDRRRFVGRSGERAARSQWKVPWPMIGVISLMALLLATENRSLPVIGTAAAMLLLLLRLLLQQREFHAVEKLLSESERTYRMLLEHAPMGVLIERNGAIVYANWYCVQTFGLRPEEMMGRPIADLVEDEDRGALQTALAQLTGDDSTVRLDMRAAKRDEHRVHLDIQFRKFEIQEESHVIAMFLDITERKRVEEKAMRSEKLSVVGQLAAGVAHEIRNPLTALKGFTQLMSKKTEAHRNYFDIMLAELERINGIVNEFMLLSKPQQLQQPGVHNIGDVLRSIIPIIETHAVIHNVAIHVDWDARVPPVYCDSNQIKQLFINLIKNAVEAMPGGGRVDVSFGVRRDDGYVNVMIMDQGPGIPQEYIPRLGEPFFSTKNHGTGLGLMVCQRIVEAHSGTLLIRSEVNKGTVVEFALPPAGNQQ